MWKPQEPNSQGTIAVGDWQPVRAAIEAAYGALGIPFNGNIEQRDWNLVVLALDHVKHHSQPKCLQCREPLEQHEVIRCLDCKAPLCEHCAPHHFWPNGRTEKSHT